MARVALVFGGRSVEHQVSLVSARTVARGLRESGHEVVPLGIASDGCWLGPGESAAALDGEARSLPPAGEAVAPTLRHLLEARPDVVFPITHGTWGEDGTLQGLCEMLDLAYVGAGVAASAVAMDKALCKRVFAALGVPSVEFRVVRRGEPVDVEEMIDALPWPMFVKPSSGGSSVGVRKVRRAEELRAAIDFALLFDDVALVERGVDAREIECGVLGSADEGGRLLASVLGEIVPGNEFYDYQDKYLQDRAGLIAPADLDPATAATIRDLAVRAFAAVRGEGMARVDFLVDRRSGEAFVNEINTLPGFTAISMYPRLWGLSGVPLGELTDRLVREAVRRHADRRRLDAGIKRWLLELS